MIVVSLVGKVVDRPFRPGGGARVVLKFDAEDETGRTRHLELDSFAEVGDWVMKNVMVGEVMAVTARLEDRIYMDKGEEVEELRLVATRYEPLRRAAMAQPNRRSHDRDRVPGSENRIDVGADHKPDPNYVNPAELAHDEA